MHKVMPRLYGMLVQEEGQNLAEYALLVVLIGLAAVFGLHSLALEIQKAFLAITI